MIALAEFVGRVRKSRRERLYALAKKLPAGHLYRRVWCEQSGLSRGTAPSPVEARLLDSELGYRGLIAAMSEVRPLAAAKRS